MSRFRRISLAGVLLVIVAIPVLYYVGLGVLRLTIRPATPVPFDWPMPVAAGDMIEPGQGTVEIAQRGDFTMELDTNTLNIALTHGPTGRVFNTLATTPGMPSAARSPLMIRFLGEDSMLYEWDAYNYAIANEQFRLYEIEDGVQFVLHFEETDSTRLMEYLPSRITIERFHEAFIDEIDNREAAGAITPEDAAQFRTALGLVFARDDAEGVYFYMLGGLPPRSLVLILIDLTRQIEYTREDLISDMEYLGLEVTFVEPASFTITMNHTLTYDGDFVVDIPLAEHVNDNPFFVLQNVRAYPAFDAAFDDDNTGFIFVPDGAGKLIALDTFDIRRTAFNRPVFNNNLFDQDNLYFRSNFGEDLHMPVFGMWQEDDAGVNSGFFTIIESGAQTSFIGTTLRASGGGAGPMYNAVFASIDVTQFSRVRIFGPLSADPARYLSMTGPLNPHFTLRYVLFPEEASYFAFAQEYRQFLIDTHGLEVTYDDRAQIFVEFIGAVTLLQPVIGVPRPQNEPMTTYAQAADIIEGLRGEGINVVANFMYGLNGGRANYVGDGARRVRSLGSNADLDRLIALSAPGNEVFIEASLMRTHRTQTRYNHRRFQLSDFSGFSANQSRVVHPDGGFTGWGPWSISSLIHPMYLPHVVNGFMSDAGGRFPNVMLTDMGNLPFANYDPRDIVCPYVAQFGILHPMLERLAGEMNLALDNPNSDRMHFASYALNISRESSATGAFYTSVPFRQLVMSGLVEFTTLNVNGAVSPPEYFLLQAIELGSIPKFQVFYGHTSVLLLGNVSNYFSHEYRRLSEDIRWLANAYAEAFEQIGTKEIANHETLMRGVFVTTYANGVRVYVNYNLFPVSGEGFELPALGFEIVGGAS